MNELKNTRNLIEEIIDNALDNGMDFSDLESKYNIDLDTAMSVLNEVFYLYEKNFKK